MKYDYVVVGAGFAGAVIAERLATQANKKVLVIDKRNHIGGNCYDYTDNEGILIQKYGPHIFHTNNKLIWDYLSKFTEFNEYKHKVLAFYNKDYYPIPINLDTVNKFYNLKLKNEGELKKFLEKKRINLKEIKNSRDVVVSKFGEELYEAFIKNYTKKQWGVYPEELNKEVLERIPIRYDKNPYYFNDLFQGLPVLGFAKIFENMLNHPNIKIMLNTDFLDIKKDIKYKKLIFTGPIDSFFNYKFGRLDYRGIRFIFGSSKDADFQPNSVINYTEKYPDFSRITDFNKLYNKKSDKTKFCAEFFVPGEEGEPCYPVINEKNTKLLEKYLKEAKKLKDTYFIGRFGKYKYLNMDKAIEESLKLFEEIKHA
ncbi:MAG: UDP-galactopyranose mutase [Candidatus Pacearchaeota archaeon]